MWLFCNSCAVGTGLLHITSFVPPIAIPIFLCHDIFRPRISSNQHLRNSQPTGYFLDSDSVTVDRGNTIIKSNPTHHHPNVAA